jgi:LuxR family maltose regulon positive regulatory protein
MHMTLHTDIEYYRPRLHKMLEQALTRSVTIIRAGAGYGKSTLVRLYCGSARADTHVTWLRLTEKDNDPMRFWESYIHAVAEVHPDLAEVFASFYLLPTDSDKMGEYLGMLNRNFLPTEWYVFVLDDLHKITNSEVLRFVDLLIHSPLRENWSVILTMRTDPKIDLTNLYRSNLVSEISENDLRFNRGEIAGVLDMHGVHQDADGVDLILEDTAGCAFTLNLVSSLLNGGKKYRMGMAKDKINDLIESEVWAKTGAKLKVLLLRMSLIELLHEELVKTLVDGDESLLSELNSLDRDVLYDSYRRTYVLHDLFRVFLQKHQGGLTDDERKSALTAAANWCKNHEMKNDAVRYYCMAGDYESAAWTIYLMHLQPDPATAKAILAEFNKASDEYTKQNYCFSIIRLRLMLSIGRLKETLEQADREEEMYQTLPDGDRKYRKISLLYIARATALQLLCAAEDGCDFIKHFTIANEYYKKAPYTVVGASRIFPPCSYAAWVGSNRKGAVDDYITAVQSATPLASHVQNGYMSGLEELLEGEQLFFQYKLNDAEKKLKVAAIIASEHYQHDIRNTALRYLMWVQLKLGNQALADTYLAEIEAQMSEKDYQIRSLMRDMACAIYYLEMRRPELVPISMQDRYLECAYGVFKENGVNHIKMRWHYQREDHDMVLMYKKYANEVVIYGKIEWLVYQALSLYAQNRTDNAFRALEEAYRLAEPNGYIMSFVEAGDGMIDLLQAEGTLARSRDTHDLRPRAGAAAEKTRIPASWISYIKKEASALTARQMRMVNTAQTGAEDKILTPREHQFLFESGKGSSRDEIAKKHHLSKSTVDKTFTSAYEKLDVGNLVDALRVARDLGIL